MKCPFCGFEEQKVLDSRPARDGEAIRRRRECTNCERRFTTFEEPERPRMIVVKRRGEREDFSRDKVISSMLVACRKRPVSYDQLREAAERIERDLFQRYVDEAPSRTIGDSVLDELRKLDIVAFVRFASVYQEFKTVTDFRAILESAQLVEANRE